MTSFIMGKYSISKRDNHMKHFIKIIVRVIAAVIAAVISGVILHNMYKKDNERRTDISISTKPSTFTPMPSKPLALSVDLTGSKSEIFVVIFDERNNRDPVLSSELAKLYKSKNKGMATQLSRCKNIDNKLKKIINSGSETYIDRDVTNCAKYIVTGISKVTTTPNIYHKGAISAEINIRFITIDTNNLKVSDEPMFISVSDIGPNNKIAKSAAVRQILLELGKRPLKVL